MKPARSKGKGMESSEIRGKTYAGETGRSLPENWVFFLQYRDTIIN
jgi:hypothetical protein